MKQAAVRQHLRAMMYAESRAECEKARGFLPRRRVTP
jgi:hypothetical protein